MRGNRHRGSGRAPSSTSRLLAAFVVAAVAVAAVAATSVVVIRRQRSASRHESAEGPRRVDDEKRAPFSTMPAGRGAAWADEVQREDVSIPIDLDPITGTRMRPFRSHYTNIVDGERRTRPTTADGTPTVVWLVGGSAAFGEGQRDDHTIASELVRLGDEAGLALEVHNLGVLGWTLWQEQADVLRRLASGGPRPALIVFYDGFNDAFYSTAASVGGDQEWDRPVVFSSTAAPGDLTRAKIDAALRDAGGVDEIARRTAERFRRLQAVVAGNVRAHDIATEWFLQVDATASPEQFAAYSRTTERGLTDDVRYTRQVIDQVLDAVEEGDLPETHDLRSLVGDDDPSVFFDMVHTNEVGATLVADAMWEFLGPRLRELAATG